MRSSLEAVELPEGPRARRLGLGLARCLGNEGEWALWAMALRRRNRWRAVGLVRPPVDVELEGTEVQEPQGPRQVLLDAFWLLDGGGHLLGTTLVYGWEASDDRRRLVSTARFDARPQAEGAFRDAVRAALALLLARRSLHAVVLAEDDPAAVAVQALAGVRRFALGARHYVQLTRAELQPQLIATPADAPWTPRPADLIALNGFGPGGWPTPAPTSPPPKFELVVRDPSSAHADLLRSGAPQRRWLLPELRTVEEVDVLVVGAGLAGLTAAHALAPRRTLVLERADRIAGTGASFAGLDGPFPLAAHYECELQPHFGAELLALYEGLGVVQRVGEVLRFVEAQHYVPGALGEQSIGQDGRLRFNGWRAFYRDPQGLRLRDVILSLGHELTLPSRQSSEAARRLAQTSFGAWLRREGFRDEAARQGLDVLMRSDYGGDIDTVSAFAGLHYFACRPYLTTGTKTFAPPEGLAYFAERLVQKIPSAEVRSKTMVRRLWDRGDRVEVLAVDLAQRETYRLFAKAVVLAMPKKQLRYLFAPDARLFAKNRYAAWATVTMELEALPERELLCWANHVWERTGVYVGCTWHNPGSAGPVVLTHYLVWPPGRRGHLRLLHTSAQGLVELCFAQLGHLLGRDVRAQTRRVVVQKLGHSMPTPVPGSLFTDPNGRRHSERIVYAGVDTGRLPLLAEAFDSGLEAAKLVAAL